MKRCVIITLLNHYESMHASFGLQPCLDIGQNQNCTISARSACCPDGCCNT